MLQNEKLSSRFIRMILLAVLSSGLLFLILHFTGEFLINSAFQKYDWQAVRTERRIEALQEYVDKYQVAATDEEILSGWCRKQPVIWMEIYRNQKLLFNSSYTEEGELYEKDISASQYDWYSYYAVTFADGKAELVIYSDEIYVFQTWATIIEIVLCALVFLMISLRGVHQVVQYICLLSREVTVMEGGTLNIPITIRGNDELGLLARGLDSMRIAFMQQRYAEEESRRANQKMITGMSHDLRTPLTKLMLYTQILKSGKYETMDQFQEYVARIDEKAQQLKELADNLFRYSISPLDDSEIKRCSPQAAFHDSLSEMADYLSQKGFSFDCHLQWPDGDVVINDLYVRRVLDNVASNIEKYADSECPILLNITENKKYVGIFIENAYRQNVISQGGTHIGLKNISTMMEKMIGYSQTEQTEDHFSTTLWFRKAFAAENDAPV